VSFKPPAFLVSSSQNGLVSPLDLELAGEKADALGRAGRKAEAALAALAEARAGGSSPVDLDSLRDAAAEAVFALTVQRELCGLRNQADMVRRYAIPNDVMARIGVSRRR
jgi:hypothetical protein